LNPGDEIVVTLHFQTHKDIALKVPVMNMGGDMEMDQDSMP